MSYQIRPFRPDDSDPMVQLIEAAIRTIGPRAYSEQQVSAWAASQSGPTRADDLEPEGKTIFVAVDDEDRPVGFALLETDGHLDQLYCHPNHTRRGVAEQLLATAEQHARHHGVNCLYTEASELARSAFERAGYSVTHRRDFIIENGDDAVSIHNYAMNKPLR